MEVGERLKAARDWSGYTQDEVAQKANVKKDQLSRWERGTPVRDVDAMMRIADALLISLDWLFGRTSSDPHPEGLRMVFDGAFLATPPTREERAWCVGMVRSHGNVSAEEWARRISSRRRGLSDGEIAAEAEATAEALARGAALGVPRRAQR